jgi:hypothetical protein
LDQLDDVPLFARFVTKRPQNIRICWAKACSAAVYESIRRMLSAQVTT